MLKEERYNILPESRPILIQTNIVQALCEAAISYGQDLQSMENKGSAYLCKLHKYKKI